MVPHRKFEFLFKGIAFQDEGLLTKDELDLSKTEERVWKVLGFKLNPITEETSESTITLSTVKGKYLDYLLPAVQYLLIQ